MVITQGQVQHMTNLTMVRSARVGSLQQSVLASGNMAFPVGIVDNLFATEEHLRALLARL